MVVIPVRVVTDSATGTAGRPVRFAIRDRLFQVSELVDTWYGPDHTYYKLVADDGNSYIIRHDLEEGAWELVQMEVL
jgi:hypothetical protein